MGVIATAKVITASETCGHSIHLQPRNQEWVIIVEFINTSYKVIPPIVIFAGKLHQQSWYNDLPKDWAIEVNETGWMNDVLGCEWLEKVFDKHTQACTKNKY